MKKDESKSEKDAVISWKAPEFWQREKGVAWYLWAVLIGLILIGISVWQRNFLFLAFIVIAWFVMAYWANKKPTIWEFILDENGLRIILPGKDFEKNYAYGEIGGFDIHPLDGRSSELVLKKNAKLSPYLKVIFPAEKEKEIEDFLLKFLEKEEYERSASDSFSDLIGF